MSSWEEIKKELKEKGMNEVDIYAAGELALWIGTLDKLVFPENPAPINFAYESDPLFGGIAAYFFSTEENRKEFYVIYVSGLENLLEKEEKERSHVRKVGNKIQHLKPTREELLVGLASHEIRHRVQRKYPIKMFSPICPIKMFSPKSAQLVSEELVKGVIEFYELEFKEKESRYLQEKKSKRFIESQINEYEFDAAVVETLVANKIYRKKVYSLREEIAEIIKLSAP